MKKQKMTLTEKRRLAAERAMPDTKKLVKKYGRTAIQNCLLKLRDYEKSVEKLAELKNEVASLERKLV